MQWHIESVYSVFASDRNIDINGNKIIKSSK